MQNKIKKIGIIVVITIIAIIISAIGIKVMADNPKGVSTIDIPDGYYESVQIDASAVYNIGRADGAALGRSTAKLGREVSIGSEPFFVLYENGIDNTVTLFAKYCLKTDGSSQSKNGGKNTYKCVFSSTNYWSSYWVSGKTLNLNTVNGNVAGDAMTKAQVYARSLGGQTASGRLLTYEEASALSTNHSAMLYGTYNTAAGEAYLSSWLGSSSSYSSSGVWYASGGLSSVSYASFIYDSNVGVRPVITVPTSVVSGL